MFEKGESVRTAELALGHDYNTAEAEDFVKEAFESRTGSRSSA
jgi:hypothetical protein